MISLIILNNIMKTFISYSHQDVEMLDLLHKHLKQLQRENIIAAWVDNDISAGDRIDKRIANEISNSSLFLALVSPDYIASRYCYEVEFKHALKLEQEGKLTIVPIILEPCDWLSTPFKAFKALPKDAKAISTWENINTAFLDVVQNIRKVIEGRSSNEVFSKPSVGEAARNYRVERDFDSIEKLEFLEKTFADIKSRLNRYINEVTQLDNVKARVLDDSERKFECILVNRNKIASESQLTFTIGGQNMYGREDAHVLGYSITNSKRAGSRNFRLSNDKYRLFWIEQNFMFPGTTEGNEFDSQKIADVIWIEWLESVGLSLE